MAKGKIRIKVGKASRWRKGQSGATNPSIKKHREAAKGRFGNHLAQVRTSNPDAKLTTDALASHDTRQQDIDLEDADHSSMQSDDGLSLGTSSAYSLIETSHPVFGKVKRLWNSPEESHREICAVLAAVSEVVKSKSGAETETEYFAALLTALEVADDVTSTTAIVFLLSIVMERISSSVLETQFGLISKVLMTKLTDHEASESTALLKSLVTCIISLLSAQPVSVWSNTYIHTMLQTVINFLIYQKPRVRKSAQSGLVSMLRNGHGNDFHTSSTLIFKQCQRMIETEANVTVKLHVLGFLKECIGNFQTKQIKSICESILKLLTLGTTMVKIAGFNCLNGLFTSLAGPQGLTAELNGQIISAVYSHQPSLNDSQLLKNWSTVIENGHLSLQKLDQSMCIAHLPKVFTILMNCLLTKKRETAQFIAQVIQNILKNCVEPLMSILHHEHTNGSKGKCKKNVESDEYKCCSAVFSIIENGLKYKYYQVWDLVLRIIESFYGIANEKCLEFMKKSLQSLSELHHVDNFQFVSELETAFGAAVKSMGPRFVLSVVPLHLDEDNMNQPEFPHSWILPVLKNNIHKTELAFFTNEMLPLANKMRVLSQKWRDTGKQLEGRLYETLEYQIWSLLPSFCKDCTDIAASFSPSFAKYLGTISSDRSELCLIICQSLVNLIESSKSNDADCAQLKRFSKNFLPIFFNLYTDVEMFNESYRDCLLNCINSYLSITDYKLLNSIFSKLLSKLSEQSSSKLTSALQDIMATFVPYLSSDDLFKLYEIISPSLDSGNTTMQKKSYKLLYTILSCNSPQHSVFIDNNLLPLQKLLLSSLSTAGAGSKKLRLRCLVEIVSRPSFESADFLAAVVPEVILCTKEANEKCRNIAYHLLNTFGYAAQRCYQTSPEGSFQQYLSVILAGLTGSMHMVSATIGSMARLVYEFNDLLGSELISKLLTAICAFFSSKSKEVVRSTLIFVKVVIGVLPCQELLPHLEELVTKILKWNENHKSHFRMKSRYILEKLTQKFSYEMVEEYVPVKHKRLIHHIRKTVERKKRQDRKQSEILPKDDNEDFVKVRKTFSKPSFEDLLKDSDGEDDNMEDISTTAKSHKVSDSTWLKEGLYDDPLDFMDPSVTKRIVGTNPTAKTQEEITDDSFEYTPDGKMIIHDDEDDLTSEESTDEEDMMAIEAENNSESNSVHKRLKQKRKRQRSETESQNEGGLSEGTGIYRKNPQKSHDYDYGAEYRAKRAKGDVKRTGKPDPYAYIQLDRQKLNKRKKAKLSGQFKHILHHAKKGASKGKKQRRK